MSKTGLLLEAFEGRNQTVPVWFMRQAGRYLPEYQAIKKKYSLEEMFSTPELAAEITCLPIEKLGVDAAILFADILTLPKAMGCDVRFDSPEGPVITQTIQQTQLHDLDDLPYIRKIIQLVRQQLPAHIPLIGFAGSPFTVLVYLLEQGSSLNCSRTIRYIFEEPEKYHHLMDLLTKNTIRYYQLQKKAGIQVFQLFDTWAGILRPSDYSHLVLPYVSKIFEAIDLPSIYYAKNCHHLLPLMDKTKADFLSVCHTVVLGHHTTIEKTKKGIQGNLFNGLLYADQETLKKEIRDVLIGGQKHKKYIFNLSHGVLPDVSWEKLKFIADEVHAFPWKR